MTDSIGKVLHQKQFEEPPEIAVIKKFLNERFSADVRVTFSEDQIVLGVKGAALAGSLRLYLHELAELCPGNKRLIIKIV